MFASATSPSANPCVITARFRSTAPAYPTSFDRRLRLARSGHAPGAAMASASVAAAASSTAHPPRLSLRRRHRGERSADARRAHPPPSSTGSSGPRSTACAGAPVSGRWTPILGLSTRESSRSAHRGCRRNAASASAPSPHTFALARLSVVVGPHSGPARPEGDAPSRARIASRTARRAAGEARARPLRLTRDVPFAAARSRTTRDASSGPSADAERDPRARETRRREPCGGGAAASRGAGIAAAGAAAREPRAAEDARRAVPDDLRRVRVQIGSLGHVL